MKRTLVITLSACATMLALASPARAALIVDGGLTLDTAPTDVYQQTAVNPCVIGAPNCLNGGFPFVSAGSGGNGTLEDIYSLSTTATSSYTVAQITGVTGGSNFTIGIDWNQTSVNQTLYEFEAIYYNGAGAELSRQTFDDQQTLDATAQGNGYSDFLLSGFAIPLNTAYVVFHANWLNNDGADRFFLIGANAEPCDFDAGECPPVIPEPASTALFAIGLAGAAAAMRRRQLARK